MKAYFCTVSSELPCCCYPGLSGAFYTRVTWDKVIAARRCSAAYLLRALWRSPIFIRSLLLLVTCFMFAYFQTVQTKWLLGRSSPSFARPGFSKALASCAENGQLSLSAAASSFSGAPLLYTLAQYGKDVHRTQSFRPQRQNLINILPCCTKLSVANYVWS